MHAWFLFSCLVSVLYRNDRLPSSLCLRSEKEQVGRANAFKARIEQYVDSTSTKVGLACIARSSTKKEDEDEEVHKHCIGDVRG